MHKYFTNAVQSNILMGENIIEQIANGAKDTLHSQFNKKKKENFNDK